MFDHKVYESPSNFWQEVCPHLRTDESKHSLLLGLSKMFQSNPENCIYQSALFKCGQIAGSLVVSRYVTNYNLLPSDVQGEKEAEILFENLIKNQVKVTGIVGEKGAADLYGDLFKEAGWSLKVNMTQGIYRCTKVNLPQAPEGTVFRLANENDTEIVGGWIDEFHNEATPHDPQTNGEEIARERIKKEMIYVLERQDELVSMAAWNRDLGTSCSVNLVYTPKPLRKNGYASLVTGLLTDHLLKSGKKETCLYTDMTNSTSNKIYMNLGYEFVCDSVHYGLGKD